MGDSETVVAQTSDVMDYQSTGYASTEYSHVNNTNSDGGAVATGNTVDSASAVSTEENYAIPDGNLGDQSANNSDPNTTMHEASVTPAPDGEPTAELPVTSENIASHENLAVESSQTGVYDSSVNGNGPTGDDVNGTAPLDSGVAVVEQHSGDDSAISTEEERLWSIVRANSLDFNAWTALIEETEKEAEVNILKIRKVYDAFLAEFPLCYGYWKKYADHEARLGSIEKVVDVYERAVVSVTYSVDIWLHYCVFTISTYGDPETARRLFERGLAYVGTDYLSYPLWDKYIEYEYSQQEWCHLAMIYTRILENPNQQLDRYFNSFKELAGSRPLSDIRTTEEAAAMVASGEEVEGEVHPDGEEHTEKPVSAGLNEAEELEKYVAIREEMYKKAKEFDSKIIGFETAIRRPYFHVRPLIGSELENWHNYLDFIERGDDFNKVVKLYERCLIACANYPEFWIRYVLCMEASGSMDLAHNALVRATQVFVKRQPEIHLFAARFREQGGDIQEARAAYQLLHSGISPGLLEAIIKHANMEYRLGNKEDAFSIYEQAIATERGKEHSQILPMLLVQYSRFLYLVVANGEKAREVLVGALEQIQLSKPILEALIHLESIQSVPKRIDFLDSLVDKFIVLNPDNPNTASTTDREELSGIFLEFLNLFGETQSIKKAEDRHAKLFLCHRSTSESRKRNADDFLASDKTKLAKSYAGAPSPAPSVVGAYSSTQNQWPAGYGSQQQAWAQAPQAQGQQWNAAYAQQAGYAGYSGYGSSYTQPQVAATSAPQAAAATYAAYPSYPAQQTFPQQTTYAQPATAAAVAVIAPQQQAPVAQAAYYGGGTYY